MYNNQQSPKFNVEEPFMGVTNVQMNDHMRDLLCQLINEVDNVERELFAFARALQDPRKSRELRQEKRRTYQRRNYDRYDDNNGHRDENGRDHDDYHMGEVGDRIL